MELIGLLNYGLFFLSMAGIYAILCLGLNVQWGYTGQLNIGVAAFFALGAYTSAILTTSVSHSHLGGFGLPLLIGILGAMIVAAIVGLGVGLLTLNLRSDYLAIATIGIAEIIRLVLQNEQWLTAGVRGIAGIPRPFAGQVFGTTRAAIYLAIIVGFVILVYWVLQRLYRSPWSRVLRGIRNSEPAVSASGKNVLRFRVEAFVLGCAIMGLAGALYAHFTGFISPESFDPMFATFVVWVMLIAGGSGNNRGAILGALVIWAVWALTNMLIEFLPEILQRRGSAFRILLIGLLLQFILLTRPQGILPEKPPKPLVPPRERGD